MDCENSRSGKIFIIFKTSGWKAFVGRVDDEPLRNNKIGITIDFNEKNGRQK